MRRVIEDTWEAMDTQRDRSPAALNIALGPCKSWGGGLDLPPDCPNREDREARGLSQWQAASGYPSAAGWLCGSLSCRLALEIGSWGHYYKVTVATFESTGQKSLL